MHQKAQKAPKSTKKQKSATKQKHKNANKRRKIKNALKNIYGENSNLFDYLRFCIFCACEEKKIEKRKKMKSLYNVMY